MIFFLLIMFRFGTFLCFWVGGSFLEAGANAATWTYWIITWVLLKGSLGYFSNSRETRHNKHIHVLSNHDESKQQAWGETWRATTSNRQVIFWKQAAGIVSTSMYSLLNNNSMSPPISQFPFPLPQDTGDRFCLYSPDRYRTQKTNKRARDSKKKTRRSSQ